jgi:hypothetical protein
MEGLDVLVGHGIADGQLVATLGATAGEDGAAILGGHAGTEAMLVDALPVAGLKSSLHGRNSNLKDEGLI